MAVLGRLLQIWFVVVTHAVSHYLGWVVGRAPCLRRRLPRTDLSKPERLKELLQSLGGAYVKLGQMLALQPDILPMEYCHSLYSLLDRVNPVAPDEIETVFFNELGRGPYEVFETFDRQPIASGSIGQVHVATLAGRKVAVKIQRPDTQVGFERDVKFMRAAVWIIRRLHLKLLAWMIDPLTEFAEWIVEELDFLSEARYMSQLQRNADDNHRERVPTVFMEYTTRRVLVVEFLEGVTLSDHLRLSEGRDTPYAAHLTSCDFNSNDFAQAVIDNFLGDAFRHGMFHADLHPANLMILPNNVVGYVDFGVTGVLSPTSRRQLIAMTLAYSRRELPTLCERFFDVSTMDDRSDPDAFRDGIKRLSEKWYRGGDDNPTLKTTTTMVMLDMLKLSRAARIWPQRDVIKYIRSAIAIDGLVRQFAPQFDVGHYLAVACRRHLTWHARMALCSHDAVISWSQATADLLQNGAFRMSSALERVSGTKSSRPSVTQQRSTPHVTWQLATVAAIVATLAITTNESWQLGFNLFTAQAVVAGMALATLWRYSHAS